MITRTYFKRRMGYRPGTTELAVANCNYHKKCGWCQDCDRLKMKCTCPPKVAVFNKNTRLNPKEAQFYGGAHGATYYTSMNRGWTTSA